MTNRKKRLRKGIESLQEQIRLHEEKRLNAVGEGMEELVNYYNREIDAKKKTLKEKEELLEKR